jgi:hypothetical protein
MVEILFVSRQGFRRRSNPRLEPVHMAQIVDNPSPAMMEMPDFLFEMPKVGPIGILHEGGRRSSHRKPRRKFHTASASFSPLPSRQLTGKPFVNMSNTGE